MPSRVILRRSAVERRYRALVVLIAIELGYMSAAVSQHVEQVLWPRDESECAAASARNRATEQVLREAFDRCFEECQRRYNAAIGRIAEPWRVCGGDWTTPKGYPMAHVACRALNIQWDQFGDAIDPEWRACTERVGNQQAAREVWDAASRDVPASHPTRQVNEAALELNSRVQTGNAPVDMYRSRALQSAANAATNLMDEYMRQLEISTREEAPRYDPTRPCMPTTTRSLDDCRRLEDMRRSNSIVLPPRNED